MHYCPDQGVLNVIAGYSLHDKYAFEVALIIIRGTPVMPVFSIVILGLESALATCCMRSGEDVGPVATGRGAR